MMKVVKRLNWAMYGVMQLEINIDTIWCSVMMKPSYLVY